MEKIHKNIRVFMLSCIKHACFHVFSPFSAYTFPPLHCSGKGSIIMLLHTVYVNNCFTFRMLISQSQASHIV